MMRMLGYLIVLVVLVGICWGGIRVYNERNAAATTSFKTVPVARGNIVATITATGTVEPEESIDVGAQVQGRIIDFGKDNAGKPVDNNSEVAEGASSSPILIQRLPIHRRPDDRPAPARHKPASNAAPGRPRPDRLPKGPLAVGPAYKSSDPRRSRRRITIPTNPRTKPAKPILMSAKPPSIRPKPPSPRTTRC